MTMSNSLLTIFSLTIKTGNIMLFFFFVIKKVSLENNITFYRCLTLLVDELVQIPLISGYRFLGIFSLVSEALVVRSEKRSGNVSYSC